MLDADKALLERLYPDGIPRRVEILVNKTQAIRHQYSVGHLDGNTMALLCAMADTLDEIISPSILHTESDFDAAAGEVPIAEKKKEAPLDLELDDDDGFKPKPKKKTNWYTIKGGTKVVCIDDEGDEVRGYIMGVFRSGDDKGKIRVDLPTSANEVDVFDPEKVSLDEE